MSIFLCILLYLGLLALLCLGMLLTVKDSPGLWLMILSTAAYGYLTRDHHFLGWPSLAILAGLGLAAELIDRSIGKREAMRSNASRWAGLGAMIGGILGGFFLTFLIPIPPFGTIAGICAGCFIGAFVIEWVFDKQMAAALRVGAGAAKARLLGIITKSAIAVIVFLMCAFVALPIHFFKQSAPASPETRTANHVYHLDHPI